MTAKIHSRGRNVWHSDGRPAGHLMPMARQTVVRRALAALCGGERCGAAVLVGSLVAAVVLVAVLL